MANEIADLVANLSDIRRQKRELDKTEKELLAEIKPLVDPQFDVLPKTPIEAGDLLLERGVAAEIISYATKTTTFYQYRVREAKNGE